MEIRGGIIQDVINAGVHDADPIQATSESKLFGKVDPTCAARIVAHIECLSPDRRVLATREALNADRSDSDALKTLRAIPWQPRILIFIQDSERGRGRALFTRVAERCAFISTSGDSLSSARR